MLENLDPNWLKCLKELIEYSCCYQLDNLTESTIIFLNQRPASRQISLENDYFVRNLLLDRIDSLPYKLDSMFKIAWFLPCGFELFTPTKYKDLKAVRNHQNLLLYMKFTGPVFPGRRWSLNNKHICREDLESNHV